MFAGGSAGLFIICCRQRWAQALLEHPQQRQVGGLVYSRLETCLCCLISICFDCSQYGRLVLS